MVAWNQMYVNTLTQTQIKLVTKNLLQDLNE